MALYSVTTSNARLEYDTTKALEPCCCEIDDNHFINFWLGNGGYRYAQVFTVNTSTFAVTTANSALNYTTQGEYGTACYKVDDNHFIHFYGGYANDGYVQVFTVNTSTWAVTTAASALEFDTEQFSYGSCNQIDTNHFILFGGRPGVKAQVFTVNTSTWAVTTANSTLSIDGSTCYCISCDKIDTNHFIVFWYNSSDKDGYTQVVTVNTSTWAVTTAGSSLDFDTTNAGGGLYNNCCKIDDNHFINFWAYNVSGYKGYAQIFTVNTSTWAVTTAAGRLAYDGYQGANNSSCYKVDTNHVINFWAGAEIDSYTQVFTVNTSNWTISGNGSALEFDTTVDSNNNHSCYQIDTNHFIDFWITADNDGMVQAFTVELSTAPTVSTSACDKVTSNGARGNGNITDTGGENCTRRGFCYKEGTSGDPTTSDSVAYDDGSYGTGAYTKTITGLKPNTTYRVRAYAVNTAGTGYGTTVSVTTSSAGPANVKTYKGLAAASVKTCKGLAIASVKSKKGLA